MKKKKAWLSCVLLVLGTLFALSRKKDKRNKETIYKFTFHLADKDAEAQLLSAKEASEKITALFADAGSCAAEYQSYALQGKTQTDSRDTLIFAVILPPEKKARTLLDAIKAELNLSHAWYIKEEHTYQELKKQLR